MKIDTQNASPLQVFAAVLSVLCLIVIVAVIVSAKVHANNVQYERTQECIAANSGPCY